MSERDGEAITAEGLEALKAELERLEADHRDTRSEAPARATRWRIGRGLRTRAGDDAQAIDAVQAEITLLREENARLKAAEHQGPGLGTLQSHARALPIALDEREDAADEAAQMLVEATVIRQALLDACGQIELSMAAVKAKLHRLGASEDGAPSAVNGDAWPPTANGSAQMIDLSERLNEEAG
jgi:hypothetical protein